MNYRYRPLILAALATSCTFAARGQSQTGQFRSEIIRNVLEKIKTKHFAPRPLDDAWSADVWDSYIHQLDPSRTIFLQEDINKLTMQRKQLDDQITALHTDFFDAVYAVYRLRTTENKAIIEKILAGKFDYAKPETLLLSGAARSYPAGQKEKEDLWRKQLKYQVMRNYMELKTAAGDTLSAATLPEPATEAKARERVHKWYKDQFRLAEKAGAADEKFSAYLAAAMIGIDPHTYYSGPKDKALEEQISKRYFGLGMELAEKETEYYIKRLLPGGPAAKSGMVRENDRILSISDNKGSLVPVSGFTAGEVTGMIRGDKDTEVKMVLRQAGDTSRTVTIKRGEVVDLENRAKSAVLEKNGKKFGYLYLPMFYLDPSGRNLTGASVDVAREVEALKEQEVEGIIVDLRGNGGGSLDEVVRMSSIFLPSGPVTWLRTQTKVDRYNGPAIAPAYEGPLVVMVNEGSASASEIFAAVIQDRKRGIIAGPSSTYGKGTAQMTINIGKLGNPALGTADVSYGSMRITSQKFYRITGTSTQLQGVVPDVIFQENMQPTDERERNFPTSLPCDTIAFPPFELAGTRFDYKDVVTKARTRAAASPAFAIVSENMTRLKAQASQPIPLDFATFRRYYEATAHMEKNIREGSRLQPGKDLHAQLPVNRSIRPDLLKEAPGADANKEWLKLVGQDVYIDSSVSILEDLAASAKQTTL
ncbi:carboxy terminal-processing peptidase [Chitinophaga sp.]|uniref:carboxy terminal-processing peptidase n=1 Tax=Chitinophaga sp. TaxID=1869181 RepID=UPI002F91FD0E